MRKRDWLQYALESLVLGVLVNLLFYRTPWVFLGQPLLSFFYLRWRVAGRKKKEAREVHKDFAVALLAFAASLDAGHAVENAFPDVAEELARVCGKSSVVTLAFQKMVRELARMGRPAELLSAFANATEDADIRRFANVFRVAEERGGELAQIVRDTAREMGEKMEVEEEIAAAIASKRYEQQIMCVMPVVLILYMQLTSPGYLDVLYEGLLGHGIMTVALFVYLLAFLWGQKITEVHV